MTRARVHEPASEPKFLPVVIGGGAAAAPAEVEIAVGPVVIRAGRDVEYIATLVAALRNRC